MSPPSASAGAAAEERPRIRVLSYNILAKSLGSNCIPWVMTADAEITEEVEREVAQKWKDWVANEVSEHYGFHFHKNLAMGSQYTAMRTFWSAKRCTGEEDIPKELRDAGLAYGGEEGHVAYKDHEGERVVAATLRGLLRKKLNGELGLRLYDRLMHKEEEVYNWAKRGPRLFREITAVSEELAEAAPDLVFLQEYDACSALADYRGKGQETFAQAMAAEGYAHVVFRKPNEEAKPAQGLGIFWRSEFFALDAGSGGCVLNVDLREQWHKTDGSPAPPASEMPVADRRNLAMLRLCHLPSGRLVWAANAHLMTTSRDCAKTNAYPGEVRAGELQRIREQVKLHVQPGEALIFAGDFNTDVKGLKQDLVTNVPKDLKIATGLVGEARLRPNGKNPLWLNWQQAGGGRLILREALAGVHEWGAERYEFRGEDADKHCTSWNAMRSEWIDYVWYSEQDLALVETLKPEERMLRPQAQIPDETHGSDHLPVRAVFEMIRAT